MQTALTPISFWGGSLTEARRGDLITSVLQGQTHNRVHIRTAKPTLVELQVLKQDAFIARL